MLLVPKQLKRAGMTGNVPYYGGRFTPAQAYAASHRLGRPSGSIPSDGGTAGTARSPATPSESRVPSSRVGSRDETLSALQRLLDTGVITAEEYQGLRSRVTD